MIELEYQLQFTTPAFLGNAEQNGQWRTPPIKALLRQWWRVAYAAQRSFAVRLDDMRHAEGLLFGHAWLEHDTFQRGGRALTTAARKSEVRIRLGSWAAGKQTNWNGLDNARVSHPNVKNRQGVVVPVGSQLYLGYGPLIFQNGGTALKGNAAIQSSESATLSLAVPNDHAADIEHALTLMNHYGTLGGRSRNGWGSFVLKPQGDTPALGGEIPLRPWQDALKLDWPHALGTGEGGKPMIWQTQPLPDWKAVMRRLAEIKIGLRTQFILTTGSKAPRAEDRHWLAYPVTNHSVQSWGNNARLPNTLRFKVRPVANDRLVGVIFHVPHKPPLDFKPDAAALERVWGRVHAFLDAFLDAPAQSLQRIPE